MRDYAKISPQFWISAKGRQIRQMGQDAQLIALYLITSPNSTMLGIYYLPISAIAHDIGLTLEGASKALRRLSEGAFCSYDYQMEYVWVHDMALYQICDQLKIKDNRVKSINETYKNLPELSFLKDFYLKYLTIFHLENPRENRSPSEGPLEALRSQEQEQDIKKETCINTSKEKKGKKLSAPSSAEIPEWVPKAEWDGFVEMRNKIRKPLTAHAMQLCFKKLQVLEKQGNSISDVLNQSTMSDWQDLYPIRQETRARVARVIGRAMQDFPMANEPIVEQPPASPVHEVMAYMQRNYPAKFRDLDQRQIAGLKRDWQSALSTVRPIQIQIALKKLIQTSSSPYAPTMGEFKKLCKDLLPEELGAPSSYDAYREVSEARDNFRKSIPTTQWSHVAVGNFFAKHREGYLMSYYQDDFKQAYLQVVLDTCEGTIAPVAASQEPALSSDPAEKKNESTAPVQFEKNREIFMQAVAKVAKGMAYPFKASESTVN